VFAARPAIKNHQIYADTADMAIFFD